MTLDWFVYGITAALCFGGMVLAIKKVLSLGVPPLVLNLFLFGLTFLGFVIWNVSTKQSTKLSWVAFAFLLVAAAFALIANFLDFTAIQKAPNPGYATALKSGQIVVVALLAPLFFKSTLTWPKLIGVALVVAGMVIISLF